MNAKQLARRMDGLSTKLWDEMDRVEKLKLQVEDGRAALDFIEPSHGSDSGQQAETRRKAGAELDALSRKLAGFVAELQEAAHGCGEISDLIGALAPPARSQRTYDPPDDWKV